jgi:hypothetical protein
LEGTTFKLHPNSLFEDGTGLGLEPVGGEFQPSFETGYPGGGAYLYSVVSVEPVEPVEPVISGYGCDPNSIFVLNPHGPSGRLGA